MRVMFIIFTNSWWPNRGGYQSCIILDDLGCCLLVIVLICECDQPQQHYILFVPQLTNTFVVDPQLSSTMHYGITFLVNTSWWSLSLTTIAHLALTWEWQSFTQSSKGRQCSVSQTIVPVSSTKMSITSSQSQFFDVVVQLSSAQPCDCPVDGTIKLHLFSCKSLLHCFAMA